MKKNNIYIPLIMATMMFLILMACHDDNNHEEEIRGGINTKLQLDFSIAGETGTTKSTDYFMMGDRIGFTLSGAINDNEGYSALCMGHYWIVEEEVYLTLEGQTVYAVYPYHPVLGHHPVLPIDHTTQTDILYGRGYVSRNEDHAHIIMQHVLSLVCFRFHRGEYPGEGIINEISIESAPDKQALYSYAQFEFNSWTLNYDTGQENYQPAVIRGEAVYPNRISDTGQNAGVYPKIFAVPLKEFENDGDVLFRFKIDSKDYFFPLPKRTVWESGKRYIYDVWMLPGLETKSGNNAGRNNQWCISVEKRQYQ